MNKVAPYLYKKVIEVPLYRGKFIILLTNSVKKASKYVPSLSNEEDIFAFASTGIYRKGTAFFMILNLTHEEKLTPGIIAHESVHVASYVSTRAGIEADFDNDEPLTYLVGWITNEAHKFINQKGFTI